MSATIATSPVLVRAGELPVQHAKFLLSSPCAVQIVHATFLGMNLSRLARTFGKAAVITRDVNAIKRGRVGQRITNRVVGRIASKALRGVWR